MKSYRINLLDGYVDLDSLAPDGNTFYQLTKPTEKAMGVYTSEVAYRTRNGELIYVTSREHPASYLPPFDNFNNVLWLCDGKVALHIEYDRAESSLYLLFFEDRKIVKQRVRNGDELFNLVDSIKEMMFPQLQEYVLLSDDFEVVTLNQSEIKSRYNAGLFRKWYPSLS